MKKDCRGLEITAASDEAAAAFDKVVASYLGIQKDAAPNLKAALDIDPELPMAHIMKGYFFMLMATGGLKKRVQATAAEAAGRAPKTTAREQAHSEALSNWANGRHGRAIRIWEGILEDHPLDVLALRLAHHGHFYAGDGQNLRDTVLRRLYAWSPSTPGYSFVKGMEAFGREETHDYEGAIRAGKIAVEHELRNPWAIHAVAHVHEMRDAADAGIDWITKHEAGWVDANNFRYHVWWHRMLMHLDRGEFEQVFRLYDETLWDPDSDEYLDLVNDAAMLLRLELYGQDVGDRWQPLAEKCAKHTTDQILAFVDAHYAIALAAAGNGKVKDLTDAMRAYADNDEDNATVTRSVGLPLAEAIVAHRAGDYARTVALLAPLRYSLHRLGGSHAQRDLFGMLLIDAAMKSHRDGLAKSLLSERLGRLPENAWTRDRAARAGLAA